MEAYGWRRDETTGEVALRGWVVREVIATTPQPSPRLTRVLRSVFILDAYAEQLLAYDDHGGDNTDDFHRGGDDDDGDFIEEDEEDEEAGRWSDEGANDRPWH